MTMTEATEDSVGVAILKAIDFDNKSTSEILDGLECAFEFVMSCCCPDCRKNIAKELRWRIPKMLANANAFAARHPENVHTH
jgi:hypothetical protein